MYVAALFDIRNHFANVFSVFNHVTALSMVFQSDFVPQWDIVERCDLDAFLGVHEQSLGSLTGLDIHGGHANGVGRLVN